MEANAEVGSVKAITMKKYLEKELSELKSELFKLRFSLATNGSDNPLKVKEVRKEIDKVFEKSG